MTNDQNQGKVLTLVVLISGSGSNLQSIIDAIADRTIKARITAVISNHSDAYGLERASKAGIETIVEPHQQYSDRKQYDQVLARHVDRYSPDLIILAGFMRILSPWFVTRYSGKILNIHPSLLPKYKGTNTHQRVIDAGETEHGASVHLVTEELDGGPIVIQARVPVERDDDAESLRRRVLEQEHIIYPQAIKLFAQGKVPTE